MYVCILHNTNMCVYIYIYVILERARDRYTCIITNMMNSTHGMYMYDY